MSTFKELVKDFVTVVEDIELLERKFFKKRKTQIDREKKKDVTQRKKDRLKARVNYRRNKAKIKKNHKIYRRKAKAQPSRVKTHRK